MELAIMGDAGSPKVDAFTRLYTERLKAQKKCEDGRKTLENCREALKINIEHQLSSGELAAKGFLQPHISGQPETVIPVEEWRFLKLDWDSEKAVGPNLEYIAILIGRPRTV